ncbi:hypothetical protein N0V93_008055 [Gnomoniopsis smithogilvyi]|uniref:Rhodopsin domain-containing protein n=1 Tax=Gnomoniopsis smithogilvyi TaxID=1191159 RepID=A0A9W8YM79_9PEZI|nr:hypothetical protein N0V93_008055 [Gnomoniopsis smithogilvyi]
MTSSDNQVLRVLLSSWVFTGLSALFLGLRIGCKLRSRRGLWLDDHILTASWFALLGSTIITSVSVPLGLGQHVGNVPVQNLAQIGLFGNINGTFSILAAAWSKTSFALTLLRVMSQEKWARYFLWFAMISMNIFMLGNALFQWIKCWPISKTWDVLEPGTCWPAGFQTRWGIFAGSYSALIDIILAFLPWKFVWSLQMKTKEKVGVALAMSLGVFAGITSIFKTLTIPTLESADFPFNICDLIVWGAAESAVTIIAVSIPVLRILVKEVKMTIRQKYYGGTTDDTFQTQKGIVRTRTFIVSSGPKTTSGQEGTDTWKGEDGISLNSLSTV